MIPQLRARVPAHRAATVLREVFGGISAPVAFRLWDGTEVALGVGAPPVTVVIKSPETFVRLMRHPTPLNFAEAYVESAVDVEGDLAAAMAFGDAMEEMKLSLARRLRLLASMVGP